MKGRLIDFSIGINRKQRITVEVDGDFRDKYDELKNADISVEIKKYREIRSKSANAYFHVLVNKIAAERGGKDDDVKRELVLDYGAIARDADGLTVGFKLPASVDVDTIYPYTGSGTDRVCYRGGWCTDGSSAGVFYCYLSHGRSADVGLGFRSAYVSL